MHRVEEEGVAHSHHVGIIANAYADNAQSFELCIWGIAAGGQQQTGLEKESHTFSDDTASSLQEEDFNDNCVYSPLFQVILAHTSIRVSVCKSLK